MQLLEVNPGTLTPSGSNLRSKIGDLADLVASVKSHGILEPLVCRKVTNDEGAEVIEIVAGHRRHAAAVKAELATIPIVVKEMTDDERDEAMLIENLQRVDLTPVEEARGYFRLVERGHTVKDLAKRIGRPARHVTERLALLELPAAVLKDVDSGKVGLGEAAVLADVQAKGVDAEVVADLAKKAAGGYAIEYAAEQALERKAREDVIAEIVAKSEAKGIPMIVVRGQVPEGTALIGPNGLDLEEKKHDKEPCRIMALVVGHWGKPTPRRACNDPKRHEPKGESSLKATPKPTSSLSDAEKESRRKEAERKQREVDRRGAVVNAISVKDAAKVAILALVGEVRQEEAKTAVAYLGLEVMRVKDSYGTKKANGEPKMNPDHRLTLLTEAAKSNKDLHKVAAAIAYAQVGSHWYGGTGQSAEAKAILDELATSLLGPDPDAKAEPVMAEPDPEDVDLEDEQATDEEDTGDEAAHLSVVPDPEDEDEEGHELSA